MPKEQRVNYMRNLLAKARTESVVRTSFRDRVKGTSCEYLMKKFFQPLLPVLMICAPLAAQVPAVPDWAQPGSATHVQVPPPADFHRSSRNFETPIGIFEGQSDIGGALVPGSAQYN